MCLPKFLCWNISPKLDSVKRWTMQEIKLPKARNGDLIKKTASNKLDPFALSHQVRTVIKASSQKQKADTRHTICHYLDLSFTFYRMVNHKPPLFTNYLSPVFCYSSTNKLKPSGDTGIGAEKKQASLCQGPVSTWS